ncbi:hypothetical protein HD554DRAFT_2039580 [Boletus coccyginus]|nr:hypothetical protein HD554DRAFT_2039580 [Boletus coccyginus]
MAATSNPDTMKLPSKPEQNAPRQLKQNNPSQGDVVQQLERVGNAIDQLQHVPRHQVQISNPPSFIGAQSTNDYKQDQTRYQACLPPSALTSTKGDYSSGPQVAQSGIHNKNVTIGTPAMPQAADHRSYAETLWLPSPHHPTTSNHVAVTLHPHPKPLSTVEEYSSTSAPDLHTIHPVAPAQSALLRDVFGDDSILSLSDSELEKLLNPRDGIWDYHDEVEEDGAQARWSPLTDYEGLYADNEHNAQMDIDSQGDLQEFPSNLDDTIVGSDEDNDDKDNSNEDANNKDNDDQGEEVRGGDQESQFLVKVDEPDHTANSNQHQSTSPQGSRVRTGNRSELFEDGQVDKDYDIMDRHHKRNRRPHSPSPSYLDDVQNGDNRHLKKKSRTNTHRQEKQRTVMSAKTEQTDISKASTLVNQDKHCTPSLHCSKHSKTSKAETIVHPFTMAFFGPLWGRLLNEGKAKLQLHLATEDPFPPREMAINGVCSEIIVELVISELKKCTICGIAEDYHLFLPEQLHSETEWIEFIKWKVAQLLENAQYYYMVPQTVYSSKKAVCQFPDFQVYVPDKALLLIAAMLRFALEIFAKHEFDKHVTLNAEQVKGYYNNLCQLLNQVVANKTRYTGNPTQINLQEWAVILD